MHCRQQKNEKNAIHLLFVCTLYSVDQKRLITHMEAFHIFYMKNIAQPK